MEAIHLEEKGPPQIGNALLRIPTQNLGPIKVLPGLVNPKLERADASSQRVSVKVHTPLEGTKGLLQVRLVQEVVNPTVGYGTRLSMLHSRQCQPWVGSEWPDAQRSI